MLNLTFILVMLISDSTAASWRADIKCEIVEVQQLDQYSEYYNFNKIKACYRTNGELLSKSLLSPIRKTDNGYCSYNTKSIVIRDESEQVLNTVTWYSESSSSQCPYYNGDYIALDNSFDSMNREEYFSMLIEFLNRMPVSENDAIIDRFSFIDHFFCESCRDVKKYLETNSISMDDIISFKNYECISGESEGDLCLSVSIEEKIYDLTLKNIDSSLYITSAISSSGMFSQKNRQ